ncbi:hypothetical protein ACLOJK_030060 [Asimina triloba]
MEEATTPEILKSIWRKINLSRNRFEEKSIWRKIDLGQIDLETAKWRRRLEDTYRQEMGGDDARRQEMGGDDARRQEMGGDDARRQGFRKMAD